MLACKWNKEVVNKFWTQFFVLFILCSLYTIKMTSLILFLPIHLIMIRIMEGPDTWANEDTEVMSVFTNIFFFHMSRYFRDFVLTFFFCWYRLLVNFQATEVVEADMVLNMLAMVEVAVTAKGDMAKMKEVAGVPSPAVRRWLNF